MGRRMLASLTALVTAALVLLPLDPSMTALVGVGTLAFLAVVAVALLVALPVRAHVPPHPGRPRRGLSIAQPAPSHPDTAGRARPRAPARTIPAA